MNSGNKRFEELLLVLVAGGVVIGFAVYLLFWFWPYLLYYALPVVVLSFAVGVILRLASINWQSDKDHESEFGPTVRPSRLFNHQSAGVVMALMIAVTVLIFNKDQRQKFLVNKDGREVGRVLEWPLMHKSFNESRSSAYLGAPFDSLKEKASTEVLYDRPQIAMIVWLSLILGAVVVNGWFSRKDDEEEEARLNEWLRKRSVIVREELSYKYNEEVRIEKGKKADLVVQVRELEARTEALERENLKLRSAIEFSGDKVNASVSRNGLLDRDIL